MSRSKQHDRNRRIARSLGVARGKGLEHADAQPTRDYQTWRELLPRFGQLTDVEIAKYKEQCRKNTVMVLYHGYGSRDHYRATNPHV